MDRMNIYQKMLSLLLLIMTLTSCNSIEEESDFKRSLEELSVSEILQKINKIDKTEDRIFYANTFWNAMLDSSSIPYIYQDTIVFMYKGQGSKISWNGDFNAWGNDTSFKNTGINIDSTDLWYLVKSFPNDARLDYKVTINDQNWILDPINPHQQWSGFGPNSEFRMPKWTENGYNDLKSNISTGTIRHHTINSDQLNYEISYTVYLPLNYKNYDSLAVLYVTDGHEYIDEKLGNLVTITDNLIGLSLIEPIMIVFIDPRNPQNIEENRREKEYTLNENYLAFVSQELIPSIDTLFQTHQTKRGIIGTSLGGINATYFGVSNSSLFKNVGIQSPAYWYKPEIFDMVSKFVPNDQKIMITAGTFYDGLDKTTQMNKIYQSLGIRPKFLIVNEGHSWGAWNNQLDDFLIYFYGL